MAMNGIDIASYQATLNLDNISYDFVLIKATEGTGYVNPYCDTHFQEAKARGKKRAVYHFYDFGVDPIAQANFFVDNCIGYIRDAIFVLDWEGSGVADVNSALRFLQHVESRIGYKPAIYMSEWVENHYNWSAVAQNDNGLWLAKYADYEIDNNYDMSQAGQAPNCVHWPFYFMWQWTSKGHLNGYAGDLDCDIAYLTPESWDRYAGTNSPEPTPTTTTTTTAAPAEPTTTTTTTVAPVPEETTTTTTTTVVPTTTTTTTQSEPLPTTTTTTTEAGGSDKPVQGPGLLAAILLTVAAFVVAVFNRLRGEQK